MPATKYDTADKKVLRNQIARIQNAKNRYRKRYLDLDVKLSVLLERCRELGLKMELRR